MARYPALYEEPQSPAPPRVTVSFGETTLDVRDLDGLLVAQWAYGDLRAAGPLRPGQAVILTCPASPRARLTLLDSAMLPALKERAPQAVADRRQGDGLLSGCAIGGLAGCGAGCLALMALPVVLAGIAWLLLGLPGWFDLRTPEDILRRFEQWTAPAVDIALPPACAGTDGQAVLDRLTRRLAPAGGLETVPAVTVLDVDTPLSLPLNGRVLLTRGLVERLEDGGQLAAVLAHSLGHLAQGDRLPLASHRQDGAWSLSAPSCTSEADELEADAWALRALARAGWDAGGLPSHLDRLPRGLAGPWQASLCLHPVTTERLRALRMSPPTGGTAPLSGADWQAARTICR